MESADATPIVAISGDEAIASHSVEAAGVISHLLLRSAADGVYATDAKGATTFFNLTAARLTGWTEEELLGKSDHSFVRRVPGSPRPALPKSSPDAETEHPAEVRSAGDLIFLRKDGTSFPAAYTGTSILRQGKLIETVVVFHDISERQRREQWEQGRNEILSAIIGHQSLSSTMEKIADAFVALYPAKAIAIFLLAGDQFHLEAHAGLRQDPHPEPALTAPARTTRTPRTTQTTRDTGPPPGPRHIGTSNWDPANNCPAFVQILESGATLCVASPLVSSSGNTTGAIAVFDYQDGLLQTAACETIQSLGDLARLAIEHRQLYEEVVHRSQFDPLTRLPNRLLLEDRLRQALVVAKRQGTVLAVCCIDLDRFKQINDNLGHELGDAFFKLISERLHLSVREIDTLARHGGDEFILALRDLSGIADAAGICNRLLKDLAAPMVVDGHSLTISASIGLSIFPDHGDTADLLLRNADLALQAAKRAGRAQTQVYSPSLGRQTRRAAEMVDALLGAVAQSQFRIAYQPIFTINREIIGFEALLRWRHPRWGQISPQEFIPIAERTGLIVPVGDWVIQEVCRQAMEWNAAGLPACKIFANISGVQLGFPDFASKIAKELVRSGLPPDRLELEITESWIISDLKAAANKLQKLRDLGIGIAIDDFGTGHSTFSYLQELPLDTLKIDRSFIHRLEDSAASLSTVRAITGLAQQLGLTCVAEGVESDRHMALLHELGCELVQGFFLARPLKPQAASLLLSKQQISTPLLRTAARGSFASTSRARYLDS